MQHRIKLLQRQMTQNGFHAALLWYSRDVLYYTGTAQPSFLVVLPDTYRLFVKSGFERAKEDVFVDGNLVEPEGKLERVREYASDYGMGGQATVGTELDVLPVSAWEQWRGVVPGWTFRNISPLILEQRQIKEPAEVSAIRKAGEAVYAGHLRAVAALREGISELELAAAIEDGHRKAGHEGIYFMRHPDFFMGRGLFASGPNLFKNTGVAFSLTGVGLSSAVASGPSLRRIKKGDLVLVDIPAMVNGYHMDHSRTYVLGDASDEQIKFQKDLEALFHYASEVLRPGKTWKGAYLEVSRFSSELETAPFFQYMGKGKKLHYLGHGLGLELNEPPLITAQNDGPVLAGTVIALEMHLLEEGKMAIKMEDTLLIGEEKNEFLSMTPRQLFEIRC